MRPYRFSPNPTEPASWYTCGPISEEYAKNQWKAFGFRYKRPSGAYMLDYTPKAKPVKAAKTPKPMATPIPKTIAESAKSVVNGDREGATNA